MSSGPITLERDGDVTVLTFNHPPFNLWDEALGSALADALSQVEADPPRALLIRAEGKIFTGGVDVAEFDRLEGAAEAEEMFKGLISYTTRVESLSCPSVFCAHALTLTWAMELALGCDLIVAADDAQFGLVEARIGLTPAMGGTQRLAARAGIGRALEFVMLGEPMSATTLHQWGVVNRLAPSAEVDGVARDLARQLAAGPTIAANVTRQIVMAVRDSGVEEADRIMPKAAGALFDTEDLRGGVKSFLEEGFGKATFNGR